MKVIRDQADCDQAKTKVSDGDAGTVTPVSV